MIQHSEHEKQLVKQAKKAYKKENKSERVQKVLLEIEQKRLKENRAKMILRGIMDGEEILPDDYSVNYDFYYMIDDEGGRVVRSDIKGIVRDLKRDLQSLGMKAENIRRCNMNLRKMF